MYKTYVMSSEHKLCVKLNYVFPNLLSDHSLKVLSNDGLYHSLYINCFYY